MSTLEWIIICGIVFASGVAIGLFLGCLLRASKDEESARSCSKCREEIQGMAKKLFLAGKENKP